MTCRTSVGLDARARSIAAAALDHLTGEVTRGSFAYDPAAVAAWALSLEGPARCACESGPTGFDPQGSLERLGVPVAVRHVVAEPPEEARGAVPVVMTRGRGLSCPLMIVQVGLRLR